jgi:Uma2 family endonuclease
MPMSLATPPIPTQPHRFNLERYHRLVTSGALDEDDRVELLNGIVVDMSPIGSRHAAAVRGLLLHFSSLAQNQQTIMGVQDPILLDDWSEPQPDLWLAKYRSDRYASAHPTAGDLLLVIEVADSTVDKDKRLKIPLYAQANIPEVWLVDVNTNTISVHRHPAKGQFGEIQAYNRPSDHIAPSAFADCKFTLATLFPA